VKRTPGTTERERRRVMTSVTRVSHLFGLLALSALALGCGRKTAEADPDVMRRTGELADIYEMYTMYAKTNSKPPEKPADLLRKNAEVLYPAGVRGLKSGAYVLVWRVTDRDPGTILAYEKQALTEGGLVLTADGAVRPMSAEDLNGN